MDHQQPYSDDDVSDEDFSLVNPSSSQSVESDGDDQSDDDSISSETDSSIGIDDGTHDYDDASPPPSFLRQHLPAILVALVATVLSHAHWTEEFIHVTLGKAMRDVIEDFGASSSASHSARASVPVAVPAPVPTLNVPTPYPSRLPKRPSSEGTAATTRQHHHEFRRTSNLGFCPEHASTSSSSERVRKLLLEDVSYSFKAVPFEEDVDPNLEAFDFRIPRELIATLGLHYAADEIRDDSYGKVLLEGNNDIAITNGEYQCLMNQISSDNAKGWSVAYVRPDISTFYREESSVTSGIDDDSSGQQPEKPSVKAILKQKREDYFKKYPEAAEREKELGQEVDLSQSESKVTAVATTFTGFAAKFTNLSSETLNLYWDGRGGSNSRLVGRIPPFESLGTATTPGQSFSLISATHGAYDDRFVIQRWTMTADEAHVYYDPFARAEKGRVLTDLPEKHQSLYQMWKLNQAYARDYLIKAKRIWLADFPRPAPFHFMWQADYFGQTRTVQSSERHFTTMPSRSELKELNYDQYEMRTHREAKYGKKTAVALANHRRAGADELELKMKTISCAPRVFQIDEFLSKVEVEHIIGLVKDGSRNVTLTRSTLHPGGQSSGSGVEERNNEQTDKATRSSTNAWVEREASPIVDAIYRRAADVLRIDESLLRHRSDEEHPELATDHSIAESMQLVHYGLNEEYTPHHDFTYPEFGNRYQPGRFATLLLYLNNVEEGGETVFPRAISSEYHDGISIQPKAGTAILFYNSLPDGNFDDLSQHQSKKVLAGEKWMANLWVWDPIID